MVEMTSTLCHKIKKKKNRVHFDLPQYRRENLYTTVHNRKPVIGKDCLIQYLYKKFTLKNIGEFNYSYVNIMLLI